jgi:hypothetical protein
MYTIASLTFQPPVNSLEIWNTSIAIVAVFVSVVSMAISAHWQIKLERRRIKQDLFLMRFEVYKLIVLTRPDPKIPLSADELNHMIETIERAKFIFSPPTLKLFEEFQSAQTAWLEEGVEAILGGQEAAHNALSNPLRKKAFDAEKKLREALKSEMTLVDDEPS